MCNAKVDLPKTNSEKTWKTVTKKNGPRIAPEIRIKQSHDVLNQSNDKIVAWFRNEYPEEMQHMEKLSIAHEHKSCPPCSQSKPTRAPFKQEHQNSYALFDAVSSDATGTIEPADEDGKTFV